jgi:hypothetical protein
MTRPIGRSGRSSSTTATPPCPPRSDRPQVDHKSYGGQLTPEVSCESLPLGLPRLAGRGIDRPPPLPVEASVEPRLPCDEPLDQVDGQTKLSTVLDVQMAAVAPQRDFAAVVRHQLDAVDRRLEHLSSLARCRAPIGRSGRAVTR